MKTTVFKAILRAAAASAILSCPIIVQAVDPGKSPEQAGKSPVKVFILAGQSNMEGQGFIGGTQQGTLETLVKDPASAARYKHLVANGGKWAVRDDVWCAYGKKGKLTVGGFAADGCIGPELGIGWVVGDYLDNQVLLIKVAVGGTSLAQNWRPPSSGGEVGGWYKEMIRSVKEQLQNLKTDFPSYDGKGYEIAGFCWHQGWQDGCVDADGWDGTAKNSPTFAPVGSFKPNAFGLYDMHGNVLEWCSDFYAAYSADRQTDPAGPATGGKYVVRGGDWSKSPEACRSARRFQAAGGRAFNRDGFRVTVGIG